MKWTLAVCLSCFVATILPMDLYAQREDEALRAELVALTVGFSDRMFYDVDANDAQAITRVWIEALIRKINSEVEDPVSKTIIFHDLPSIIRRLQAEEVDLLILPPLEYLTIRQDVLLEPIITGVVGETFPYEYVLLVRRNRGPENLGQLRDKKLVLARRARHDIGSKRGLPQTWLDTSLLKSGLPESRDLFNTIEEVNKTSHAVLPVFFGQGDACLVPLRTFETMVELNPQLGEELTALITSPGFCIGLVCARKDVYEKYEGFIQEGLSALSTEPEGQQLLTIFRLDQVIPFEPVHLEAVRKLVEEYELLKTGLENEDTP